MTTHQTQCDSCGRATPDGVVLCHDCLSKLEQILAETPAMVRDLELVFRRQTRYTDRVGSRSSVTPLPYDSRAGDLLRSLHHELAMAVRWIIEPRGMDWPTNNRGVAVNKTSGLACWLLAHVGSMRVDVAGADIHRSLTSLWARAQRLVDAPPERWYAGPCRECGADLFAASTAGKVMCQACGLEHDVAQIREALLAQASDRLATAKEAAAVLRRFSGVQGDIDKLVDRIRKRADRGQLEVRGETQQIGRDRRLFRVGDVLTLLLTEQDRHDTRKAG